MSKGWVISIVWRTSFQHIYYIGPQKASSPYKMFYFRIFYRFILLLYFILTVQKSVSLWHTVSKTVSNFTDRFTVQCKRSGFEHSFKPLKLPHLKCCNFDQTGSDLIKRCSALVHETIYPLWERAVEHSLRSVNVVEQLSLCIRVCIQRQQGKTMLNNHYLI